MQVPRPPSRITSSPHETSASSPGMPTAAGIPSDFANTDVCDVLPPFSVAKASIRLRSSLTVSEGERSSATKMTGCLISESNFAWLPER